MLGIEMSHSIFILKRDDKIAKFWIDPVRLQNSGGFSRKEINQIQKIIQEHQINLRENWNEYFSG